MTTPISITFSDEPLVPDAPRRVSYDVVPFLQSLLENGMHANAGQWVGALLVAAEDPFRLLKNEDVVLDHLAGFAKDSQTESGIEFYGLAMMVAGMNAAQTTGGDRYQLLPTPASIDTDALREFALDSINEYGIEFANAQIPWDPIKRAAMRETATA